jgi:hypothetical protein
MPPCCDNETYPQANFRVALHTFSHKLPDMLALIASPEGESAVLMFPVEQTDKPREVQYRLRWPRSAHATLKEWSKPRTLTSLPAVVRMADPAAPAEAQWRVPGDGAWRKCVPMSFAKSRGEFRVDFLADRPEKADPDLDAMALVGGFPSVYRIRLPFRAGGWSAGESVTLPGEGMEDSPGQSFPPGGFTAVSSAMRITGLSSQVTLRKAKSGQPGAKCRRHPRAFMVRTGERLAPDEIAMLKKEADRLEKEAQEKEVPHG